MSTSQSLPQQLPLETQTIAPFQRADSSIIQPELLNQMQLSSLTPPNQDSIDFEQAFKQFSLETQRLDMTYHSLEDKFHAVQQTLQESHTRISGKLAELDFISKYLESILEHISQGILFIDLHSIVTTYNASAQKILDIPEKSLLFHSFTDFFDDAFLGFSLKEALFTKKCPKNGFLSWKKGTEVIELEVEATFVSMSEQAYPLAHRGSSSQPIQGLVVLLRDVTRVRHLQQVANHHDRLKDLGELAAHLAHEIRNPLGGIKGFASLLEQELKERPDLHQMATYIVQGSDDLNHFVTQVLQYARPYQLHVEKIDLIQLAEEIRQLMQVDANWSDQIEFVIQSSLNELFAMIDPFLFKSAILNLCVNAVQAMPLGGRLLISIEEENEKIKLSVEDTGTGIQKEHVSKIFSPFFTTKEKGNGLGLAEVQKVVQAHQGWIEVKSEVGKGTQFSITIPTGPT